jgi:8-oxo-dGTP pyrophosphatase MutT (NUDIX family)
VTGPPEKPWLAALRSVLPRLRLVTLGVRAVVHWDGRLVLVRHRFHDRARWHLPGGGVDAREDAAQAALRETQEEAGIPASNLALRSVHGVFLNEMTGWDDHVLVFVADASAAPCTLPLSWEIVEARAFSWDALPELSPGTARRLQDVRSAPPLRSGRW